MNLREIEAAASRFKACPKCNSTEGFWLGLKSDHAYVQCKHCGAKFELFKVYPLLESKEKGGGMTWIKNKIMRR